LQELVQVEAEEQSQSNLASDADSQVIDIDDVEAEYPCSWNTPPLSLAQKDTDSVVSSPETTGSESFSDGPFGGRAAYF
jgi:hypothetical protein